MRVQGAPGRGARGRPFTSPRRSTAAARCTCSASRSGLGRTWSSLPLRRGGTQGFTRTDEPVARFRPALRAAARASAHRSPASRASTTYLRTVTFYVNPDQLSVLSAGAIYYSHPDDVTPLVARFGSGCMQLAPLFDDLEAPQALIGALDQAARADLDPCTLAFTVTRADVRAAVPVGGRSAQFAAQPVPGNAAAGARRVAGLERSRNEAAADVVGQGRMPPGQPSGARASSMSAMRSAGSSRPTESRKTPSPAYARYEASCSGVRWNEVRIRSAVGR